MTFCMASNMAEWHTTIIPLCLGPLSLLLSILPSIFPHASGWFKADQYFTKWSVIAIVAGALQKPFPTWSTVPSHLEFSSFHMPALPTMLVFPISGMWGSRPLKCSDHGRPSHWSPQNFAAVEERTGLERRSLCWPRQLGDRDDYTWILHPG